jgi:cytochrome c oxidase subunit 3
VGFFQQLTEKPWVAGNGTIVDLHDRRAFFLPTATLALRMFLAVATVLFSLLIIAYSDRMVVEGWRPLPEPWLLWLNTAILIASSAGMQWAAVSARRGEIDGVRVGLLGGGVFAFAFLVGQLLVWQELVDLGYFVASNPANAFFYLITAIHGVHLLGGLVAWGLTSEKVWGGIGVVQVRLSVELCAVYWHFLLLVWLILFCLLLFT